MIDTIDSVLLFADMPVDTIFGGVEEPVVIDPTEGTGVVNFFLENWGEIVIALLAFVKVLVNLTPTTTDNQVFGWIDTLINTVINDRRKAE